MHDVLGLQTWERQDDILDAVEKHERVVIRSGHKVSKTITAACVAWWWFHSFDDARVVCTAPTAPQIRNLLWREIKLRGRRAKVPFPHVPETPATGIRSADGSREIVGISTDEAERMQGFSSPNMLYIIDEGSGVEEVIFEAIEGNLAGGAHVLMLGNPTQPAGTFYNAFNDPEESELWHTLHVSSWEAARSKRHIPGMATLKWCEEKLKGWGPDDPRYQVRVEGDFANFSESAIIPLAYITKANNRWDDAVAEGELQLGVDPARFGDDESVIAVRRGNCIIELVVESKIDEEALVAKIHEAVERHHIKGEGKALVKVDAEGMGLGVISLLRTAGKVRVLGVRASDPADNEDKFVSKRAQLWFNCAQWLRDGGSIPRDAKLEGDLLAPKYDFDERNRYRVEKKKDIKKRLKRSPDRADAVCLAVFQQRVKLVHSVSGRGRSVATAAGGYRWSKVGRGY